MKQLFVKDDLPRLIVNKLKDSPELTKLLLEVDLNKPTPELIEALDLVRVEAFDRKSE